MSASKVAFRCNQCWEVINDNKVIITACSHIFCPRDAHNWFANSSECPCCSRILHKNNGEVIEVRLDTSHDYQLWGQSPKTIMNVASNAMGFWMYQKKQEIAYQQHLLQRDRQVSNENDKRAEEFKNLLERERSQFTSEMKQMQVELQRSQAMVQNVQAEFKEKASDSTHNYSPNIKAFMILREQVRSSPRGALQLGHSRRLELPGPSQATYTSRASPMNTNHSVSSTTAQANVFARPLMPPTPKQSSSNMGRQSSSRPSFGSSRPGSPALHNRAKYPTFGSRPVTPRSGRPSPKAFASPGPRNNFFRKSGTHGKRNSFLAS